MTGRTERETVAGRKRSYAQADLAEVADGLARLLDAIDRGELTAGPGTATRLEGAMIALRSLAEDRPVAPEDLADYGARNGGAHSPST